MLTMYVVHTDRDLTDLTSVPDRRAGFLTGSFSTPCILSQGVPPKLPCLSVLSAIVLSKNKKMLCNSVIYLMVIPLSSEKNTSVNQYIP